MTEETGLIFIKNCAKCGEPNEPDACICIKPGCGSKEFRTKDDILKSPGLIKKIQNELEKKIVGEEDTRLAIFLFSCICLVKNRGGGSSNCLLVNAESSAGKDYVTKNVLNLWDSGKVESVSRATPQTFTYWKQNEDGFTWDGKILRLADVPSSLFNNEGFRTFLTDDEKSVVVNKGKKGEIAAFEYIRKGKPVMILTTANANPNNEALNRVNLLMLNETEDQTRAINFRRLQEASGRYSEADEYDILLKGALSKLQQVVVIIPFAEFLADYLPTTLRARRDVPRILNLLKASAALHQFQREKDEKGRITATKEDYELVRRVVAHIQTGRFVDLTRGPKKCFDAIREYYEEKRKSQTTLETIKFTVRELFQFKPIYTERRYYDHINKLLEKGILSASDRKTEGSTRPVTEFELQDDFGEGLCLPDYEELLNPSFPSNYSISSISSNPSKPSIPSNAPTSGGSN